jgi:hypothetical protein
MPQKSTRWRYWARHREAVEHHRDDEDVVDAERLLEQVAREVERERLDTVGDAGVVLGELDAEPVLVVDEVDDAAEADADGDPQRGPARRLLEPDDVVLAVQDAEVERQERHDENEEC